MKKRSKRFLTMALALAMSCSMITGWANTMTVTEVKVLNDDESAVTYTYVAPTEAATGYWVDENGNQGITLTAAQRMQVTLALKTDDAAATDGEATFLSYIRGTASGSLSDSNIQYVDQETVDEVGSDNEVDDGTTVITFRPRTSLGINTFVAQAGGTAVSNVASFDYEVVAEKIAMTITGDPQQMDENSAPDDGYSFTLNLATNVEPTTVKLGSALVKDTGYTYSNGTLTITATALNALVAGNYNLEVTADGYKDGILANAVVVNEVEEEDVAEGEREEVSAGLENVDVPSSGGSSVDLPSTTVGSYEVKYEIVDNTEDDGVEIVNGTLTLDTDVKPFAKVDVKVYAGTGDTCYDTKTVYLVPEPAKVAFGNVGLVADGANDAFAYNSSEDTKEQNDAFYEMVAEYSGKLADRATARNLVLGKGDKADVPHFAGALDYDQDGTFNIAEYRIYKLMMDGNVDSHKFVEVNAARQGWIDKANPAE